MQVNNEVCGVSGVDKGNKGSTELSIVTKIYSG